MKTFSYYFQLSRNGSPGSITLLTIFSAEELSIQRFESLGGSHLHVTSMCICLSYHNTSTLLHLEVHWLDTALSQNGKKLCNLKNPNHLIFWD